MVRSSGAKWALGGVLFCAAVLLPLFRERKRRSWLALWGEDGHVFYQQAFAGGFGQFFKSFSGYLSLPPRLISYVAVELKVPIEWLAVYYSIAGTIVTALLAAFVYRSARGWVSSPKVRLALAALVVLMPAAGGENTASSTNTIWAFAGVLPWALISEENDRRDLTLRCLVAFLAATATGLSFLFLPMAIGLALLRRTRAVLTVAVTFTAGLVVQGLVMLQAPSEPPPIPIGRSANDLVNLVGARIFALYLFGDKEARALWEDHGRLALLVSTLVMCGLCALALRGAGRRAQAVGSVFFCLALLTFLVPVWGRGTTAFGLGGKEIAVFQHIRYSVVPTLMLASGLAVLLAPTGAARSRATARWGRPVFVVHVVVVIVACFPVTGYRSEGPTWRQNVAAARVACETRPSGAVVEIYQDRLRFWRVRVPCGSLRR